MDHNTNISQLWYSEHYCWTLNHESWIQTLTAEDWEHSWLPMRHQTHTSHQLSTLIHLIRVESKQIQIQPFQRAVLCRQVNLLLYNCLQSQSHTNVLCPAVILPCVNICDHHQLISLHWSPVCHRCLLSSVSMISTLSHMQPGLSQTFTWRWDTQHQNLTFYELS